MFVIFFKRFVIFFIYLFIYTFFFFDQPTGQTRGRIFTSDSSKEVKSRKDVPFGGLNDVPINFVVKPQN